MHIELSGRRALVTGSTAGIGKAIAVGLARAGAAVIVNGRDEERTRQAAEDVAREAGGDPDIRPIAADVASADGCAALVDAAGDVDVLVNNAGFYEPATAFELTDDQWQRAFDANVMSGVRLTRHYLPRMVGRGWGRAIFISSESALQIPVEMIQYGMTKTAQLAVARGFAEAVAGTGVTVNSVLPGPTLTEGVRAMLEPSLADGQTVEEAGARFVIEERPSSLIRRQATPEEVANLVVYIASPQASATTGAALSVDGGIVRAVA